MSECRHDEAFKRLGSRCANHVRRPIHRMAVHTAVGGHEMNIGDKVTPTEMEGD